MKVEYATAIALVLGIILRGMLDLAIVHLTQSKLRPALYE